MKKLFMLFLIAFNCSSTDYYQEYWRLQVEKIQQEQLEKQPEKNHTWLGTFTRDFFEPKGVSSAIKGLVVGGIYLYLLNRVATYFSEKNQYKPVKVNERFSSVAGSSDAKDALEYIVDFLKNSKKHSRLGARVPRGILLVGGPGNGKTLLARATAGEANCAFFSVTGSEFDEVFVGTGAARLRALFASARKHAPAIIFIDEIDALARKRGIGHIGNDQTLNQLLTEMDGFLVNAQPIIVVAATNRPEALDEALLRPGRFDQIIIVSDPDLAAREEILRLHAGRVVMDPSVDFKKLALGTLGFSGAQLANLINEAAIAASLKNQDMITMENLEEARDIIIFGGKPSRFTMSEKEIKITAYHEAGHALVGLLLPGTTDPLYKITIVPRGGSLGSTHSLPDQEKYSIYKNEMIGQVMVALGGRVAEEIVLNSNVSSGAYSDLRKATVILRDMICNLGMSDKLGTVVYGMNGNYSPEIAKIIDEEVASMMKKCYAETKKLLTDNRSKLDKLAKELIKRGTLDAAEVYTLLDIVPRANYGLI